MAKAQETRQTVRGTVAAISERDWGEGVNYSFRLSEDKDVWYRTYDERYEGVVEKGNEVEVVFVTSTVNRDGRRFVNNDVESVKALSGAKPASKKASGASGGSLSKDDYWTRKEQRDIAAEPKIQYQHSQEMAMQFVQIALSTEALKLPTQLSKRLEVIEAAVDRYTARFFTDVNEQAAVKRVSGETSKEVESVEPVEGEDD